MSLAPTITPTGIIAPTYADILASLQGSMQSIYGSDIYLGNDSQDGQFVAIFADAIKNVNDAIIAAYNAFSPATAQGIGLSSVVKINGIRRLVASNSQCVVTITGVSGTLITNGIVADAANVQWALPASVTIPPSGTINVTATAVVAGATPESPGSITNIVTPTRGWQTVTNAGSATLGNPTEDDSQLRQRQSSSTSIPAISVVAAILGAIENVSGVGRAVIYENATGTTDVNGVPAHSICAVVDGGDAMTIAAVIQRYKTPGTGTYGTTTETVMDPATGINYPISFDELTDVSMATLAFINTYTGYVETTALAMSAALMAWFEGLNIGQDSLWGKLWSPINLMGDASTGATGLTQQQLDALSATYDVAGTQLYQARKDIMKLTATTLASTNTFTLADVTNYVNGQNVAIQLSDMTWFQSFITNINTGTKVITTSANIPAGKTAPSGNVFYAQGDVVIAFNQATVAVSTDMTVVVL